MSQNKIQEIEISDIIPDQKNFNKGSREGKKLLEKSFRKLGAGRSILLDKDNNTIAGNKSLQAFQDAGGKKIVIVEADRDTLIAVKRTDLDINSREGREMAMADNQTQNLNYIPDEEMIAEVAEEVGIDPVEWGMDEESDAQSETISFSAKKRYVLKIQFPTKGKLKKAEKEINKLIREFYPDATITVKI